MKSRLPLQKPGPGPGGSICLRCILKADEGGRIRRAAIASDKHDLACDRLREAFEDREGGQPVLQSFLVDEKRVPLIEPHDLQQAAADNRVKRPDAQIDLKLYRLKNRGFRVQHISGVCSYHFLALSFPRSGLALARGAGARSCSPSSRGAAGEREAREQNGGGSPARGQSRRGDAKSAHADSSILHGASRRRGEEGRGDRFFPWEGERAAPSFPPSGRQSRPPGGRRFRYEKGRPGS
ncbi:hypothetical protein ABIA14_006046 [Sinorhizobium fredii]